MRIIIVMLVLLCGCSAEPGVSTDSLVGKKVKFIASDKIGIIARDSIAPMGKYRVNYFDDLGQHTYTYVDGYEIELVD